MGLVEVACIPSGKDPNAQSNLCFEWIRAYKVETITDYSGTHYDYCFSLAGKRAGGYLAITFVSEPNGMMKTSQAQLNISEGGGVTVPTFRSPWSNVPNFQNVETFSEIGKELKGSQWFNHGSALYNSGDYRDVALRYISSPDLELSLLLISKKD